MTTASMLPHVFMTIVERGCSATRSPVTALHALQHQRDAKLHVVEHTYLQCAASQLKSMMVVPWLRRLLGAL